MRLLLAVIAVTACLASRATAESRYCVYVTNLGDDSVATIDTAFGRAVYAIPVGHRPDGIALTPDSRFAYVVNSGGNPDGSVSVIATESNTPIATIPLPGSLSPEAVAITPDGAFAYVADSGGSTLYVIATATNRVVTSIDAPGISSIAMAPTAATAYAAHTSYPGNILVIDLASNVVAHTIVTGDYTQGIAVSPDGTRVFITNGTSPGRVTVLDASTNSVIAQISVADNPRKIAVTPDGMTAYVTHGTLGVTTLSVLDAISLTLSKEIKVGSSPRGVAITPDGGFAYIANSGWDSVSVVDTGLNEVAATIGVGLSPMDVAIAPTSNGCVVPFATPANTPEPVPTPTQTPTGEEPLRCMQPLRRQLSAGHTDVHPMVVTSPGAVRLAVTNTALSSIQFELQRSTGERVAVNSGRLLDATLDPGAYRVVVSAAEDEPAAPYTLTWVSGPPSVYITIPQVNDLVVIDGAKNRISRHIRLPYRPYAIAMSPDGKRAYVGSDTSPKMLVIDTATAAVADTISLGAPTIALAITPDEMRAYAADKDQQTLSVIDLPTKSIAAKVGVGSGAVDIDVSPTGSRVYVKNHSSNTISVVDTATNVSTATIPLPQGCPIGPSTLAIAPDGTRIYAENCGAETLSIIDAETNTIVGSVRLHTLLEDVAVTSDGTLAYVRLGAETLLSIVDLDQLVIVGEVPYDFAANGSVAITPDGAFAYVTVSAPAKAAIIDTSTNSVVTQLALPNSFPGRIAVTPPDCSSTNDACVNATRPTIFPAAVGAMTAAATTDATDPAPSCALESRGHSVWYRFAAPDSGSMTVHTAGSTYETVVSTYTGSCDALVPVDGGCARDPSDDQPLSFSVMKGTTYYLMVSTPGNQGGDLAVQLIFTPRPPISFEEIQTIASLQAVERLVLVDVNSDGKPDLVAPGEVLLNDGTGRFDDANPVVLSTGDLASGLAVADLNGDGAQDVAVVSPDRFAMESTLDVFFGDANGHFSAAQQSTLSKKFYDIAVADFDSDGILDVVALSQDRLYLLHGLGGGYLAAPKEPGIDTGGTFNSAVTAAFLNGDLFPDLVVTQKYAGSLSVLLGNGDGSFRSARQYPVGRFPSGPLVTDLNGDGLPDIALVNTGETQGADVSVLFGSGDGLLQPEVRISAGFESAYSDVAAADLDGDGTADLAATPMQGSAVAVLRSDVTDPFSQHGFALDATVRGLVLGDGQTAIRAADVNGDGKTDLVVATRTGVMVFANVTSQPTACAGDCSGDGAVTVDEILTLVSTALGTAQPSACPHGVSSGAHVDIVVILQAVSNALSGCG